MTRAVVVLLTFVLCTCLGVQSAPLRLPIRSRRQRQSQPPLAACADSGYRYKLGVMLDPARDQSVLNAVTMALNQVNASQWLGAAHLDLELVPHDPCTAEEAVGPGQALIARNVTVSESAPAHSPGS
jgi:hypothetical protein